MRLLRRAMRTKWRRLGDSYMAVSRLPTLNGKCHADALARIGTAMLEVLQFVTDLHE